LVLEPEARGELVEHEPLVGAYRGKVQLALKPTPTWEGRTPGNGWKPTGAGMLLVETHGSRDGISRGNGKVKVMGKVEQG
jgi:hypothetical protein